MDFGCLYHFVVVMEELSFTKAAKRLYLSQQAVSSQIKKLEDECGVPLFTRKPTLLPTTAGTSLYHMAIEILRLQQNFQNEILNTDSDESGELRLGISYGRSRLFLPEIIRNMSRRCANVRLKALEQMSSRMLEQDLLDDKTDFYIGLTPVTSDRVQTISLRQESMVLIVPKAMMDDFRKEHDLPEDEPFNAHHSISALGKYPFVLPTPDNGLRFMFNRYANELNFFPNVLMESDQSDTLFFLALDGVGIAIYSEINYLYWKRILSEDMFTNVEVIPLDNMTEGKMILAYKKQRHLSQSDHVFIDICRNMNYFNLL